MRRAVVSNVYADDNVGGAAITARTIDLLVDAGLAVTLVPVLDGDGDASVRLRHTLRTHPDVHVAVPRQPRRHRGSGLRLALEVVANVATRGRWCASDATRAVAAADLVVGKGGHALRGKGTLGGALALLVTVHPLLLAQRLGIRTAVLGVSVGPYGRWDPARPVAARVLSRCDDVVVRSAGAGEAARALGVPVGRLRSAPDVVLSAHRDRDRPVASATGPGTGRCLATAKPFEGVDDRVVVAFLAGVLRRLHAAGALQTVELLCHAGPAGSADDRLARLVVAALAAPWATYDPTDLSPDAAWARYQAADLVLGSRVHSAVMGLAAGTLAFGVDDPRVAKAGGILAAVGADDLVLELPLDGAAVAAAVDRAVALVTEVEARRVERLAALHRSLAVAREQVSRVTDALLAP